MSKTHYSAQELAGLPGMPQSKKAVIAWANKHGWQTRQRQGRGGGIEYALTSLPAETQRVLFDRALAAITITPSLPEEAARAIVPTAASSLLAAKAKPIQTATPPVGGALAASPRTDVRKPASSAHLTSAQRQNALARLAFLNAVDAAIKITGRRIPAFNRVSEAIAAGTLAPELMAMVPIANARNRAESPKTTIGASTLRRWHDQIAVIPADDIEARVLALAEVVPQPRAFDALDDDVKRVLAKYLTKGGDCLAWAIRQVFGNSLGHMGTKQLYDRAYRALAKLPPGMVHTAHSTGASLKARRPYIIRDKSALHVNDMWVIDGHTMKGRWAHPETGVAFIPEFTAALDVSNRYCTGWSIALSETALAVSEALCNGIMNAGYFSTLYSDIGSGEKAKRLTDPVYGLYQQLGIEHRTGIPNNPQARGVIERAWTGLIGDVERNNYYFRSEKMDPDTKRVRQKALEKDIRAAQKTGVATYDPEGNVVPINKRLPSFRSLIDDITASVNAYNNRPHKGLPKHPTERRHLTPAEMRDMQIAERPEAIAMPDLSRMRLEMMPFVIKPNKRGLITVNGMSYFSDEMYNQADGKDVKAHYSTTDASVVWITDLDGRFIAEAKFEANKRHFIPITQVEAGRLRRADAQRKRLEVKIDTIEHEKAGVIAHINSTDSIRRIEETLAKVDADHSEQPLPIVPDNVESITGRPFFMNARARYGWLYRNPAAWTDADRQWLAEFTQSEPYLDNEAYYQIEGLGWPPAGISEVFKVAAA